MVGMYLFMYLSDGWLGVYLCVYLSDGLLVAL